MTVTISVLDASRNRVVPALQSAIDRLDDPTKLQARYHMGWCDAEGNPADAGGKAVRPALALLSAEAVGAAR